MARDRRQFELHTAQVGAIGENEMNELIKNYEGAFTNITMFEGAQRMAQALCTSSMVPAHYQGRENIGNAIIALEMSQRMGASPLMVMQNLYLVHGQPGWSSKFLIATFNQCGRFSAIRYEWTGIQGEESRACRAYATERLTNTTIYGPWIDWQLVKAEGWDARKGSKWKSMPEKMFQYRAAAWMIDTVAPELSMGLPPADQINDMIDITGVVVDDKPREPVTLDDLKAKKQAPIPVRGKSAPKKKPAAKPAEPAEELKFSFAQIAEMINKGDGEAALDAMNYLDKPEQRAELEEMINAKS